jgi:hypothetical protein
MRNRFWALTLLALSNCMQATGSAPKTTDIVPHSLITQSGGTVTCSVDFTLITGGAPITLGADELVTCDSVPMTLTGTTYNLGLAYVPGKRYTINLFRPVDGSSILESTVVP